MLFCDSIYDDNTAGRFNHQDNFSQKKTIIHIFTHRNNKLTKNLTSIIKVAIITFQMVNHYLIFSTY